MAEQLPDWTQNYEAVYEARHAVHDGLRLGTVNVEYYEDAPETGQVVVRASCDVCPAELLDEVNHPAQMVSLAYKVAERECPRFGHKQFMYRLRKLERFYFAVAAAIEQEVR